MINNMISIPVHEKTEVIIDQIINYQFFCPNCGIVLHISKQFNYDDSFHDEKEFMFILSQFKNVFVNPTHLDTAFADIIHTHISNFEYISQIADFEYFSMGASNDLFVRRMPNLKTYDAFCGNGIFEKSTNWAWYKHTLSDKYLKAILDYSEAGISAVRQSQIEGSSYRKELFQKMIDLIKKFYGYNEVFDKNKIVYPREEIYFSTAANLLNKNENLQFFINNYTFVAWNNPQYLPNPQQIIDIAQGKMEEKYSVKRVLRTINDPVRFQIATQIGNYRPQSMNFIKIKMHKVYRNFFNLTAGRKRVFAGFKQDESAIESAFDIKYTEYFLPLAVSNNTVNFGNLLSEMKNSREYLFVICTQYYPFIANVLTNAGFRENINFINGTLLLP